MFYFKLKGHGIRNEKLTAQHCVEAVWNNINDFDSIKNTGKLKSYNRDADVKFCSHNMLLFLDEIEYFSEILSIYSEEFINNVKKEIDIYLTNKENELFEDRKRKTPKEPLAFLEMSIKGLSWEDAKKYISYLMPASFLFPSGFIPTDEKAEADFQRFFNVNKNGTYVDIEFIRNTSIFFDSKGNKIIKYLNEIFPENRFDRIKKGNNYLHEDGIHSALFGTNISDNKIKTLKVYRGTSNPHAVIRPGDFVTPDKDYARDYIRGNYGVIISTELHLDDLIISKAPFGYNSIELIYYPKHFKSNIENNGINNFISSPQFSFKSFFEKINESEITFFI